MTHLALVVVVSKLQPHNLVMQGLEEVIKFAQGHTRLAILAEEVQVNPPITISAQVCATDKHQQEEEQF